MLLSKFIYFIHLHHICGINRETGVSQGSRSQSRQDTPSVTAAMSSSLACRRSRSGFCFLIVSYTSVANGCVLFLLRSFFLLLLSVNRAYLMNHWTDFDETWSQ